MPVDLSEGNCIGMDPELFSIENGLVPEIVKRACRNCPVKAECLAVAIEGREHGYWGGTSAHERYRLSGRKPASFRPRRLTSKEAAALRPMNQPLTKTCRSGKHAWIEENIYREPRGQQSCRVCKAERNKVSRAKRKMMEAMAS